MSLAGIVPTTQKESELSASDLIGHVKSIFDDDQFRGVATCVFHNAAVGVEGWDDPEMDVDGNHYAPQPRSITDNRATSFL